MVLSTDRVEALVPEGVEDVGAVEEDAVCVVLSVSLGIMDESSPVIGFRTPSPPLCGHSTRTWSAREAEARSAPSRDRTRWSRARTSYGIPEWNVARTPVTSVVE